MQHLRRKIQSTIAFLFLASAMSVLFTNCSSQTQFLGQGSTSNASGGTGLDGKIYLSYGSCPDGKVDRLNAVQVSDDLAQAKMIRQNCADLTAPVSVDMNDVDFALNDSKVFRMNGRIYDQKSASGHQRITVQFSRSTGAQGKVQALVWQYEDVIGLLYGSVTEANGAETGTMNVQVPSSTLPAKYKTFPGQTSEFELTADAASASLTYSIASAAQVSVGNLDVATQSSPVQPKTSLHYASGNDIASNGGALGFNLADVNTVAQLNALPAGAKGLVWLGVCNGADASFISQVTPFIGNPKLFGFALISDPDPTGSYNPLCPAANLKAESDWIHSNVSGAVTFITLMNLGSTMNPSYVNGYNPANTGIDLYGVAAYPCHSSLSGCDYGIITKAVSAVQASGVPLNAIVPVYQAAGGFADDMGGTVAAPTPDQANQMLAAWGLLVPTPVFDKTFAWQSPGTTALQSLTSLHPIFSAHNNGP